MRCTDTTILLRIAQPDNGWRVDVSNTGPHMIDVDFDHGSKNTESRNRVSAVCSEGTAAFTVLNEVTTGGESADDD